MLITVAVFESGEGVIFPVCCNSKANVCAELKTFDGEIRWPSGDGLVRVEAPVLLEKSYFIYCFNEEFILYKKRVKNILRI